MNQLDLPASDSIPVTLSCIDYSDTFRAIIQRENLSMNEVRNAFRRIRSPRWINWLFSIRDGIMKLLGVKTRDDIVKNSENTLGIFPVLLNEEKMIVGGLNDRHLDFRVVVRLVKLPDSAFDLSFETQVKFNNALGRIYFIPVKPIHKIIVPIMLNRVVSELMKLRTYN